MKVLRVIASMNPSTGGPCQGIRYSIPHLQSEGCFNEVVCLDDPRAAFLGGDSFVIHALGRGIGPLHYHPSLLPWLEEHLPDYDAVIVHGLWLWPSVATWIAIRRLRGKAGQIEPVLLPPSLSPCSQLHATKAPPYFVMPHGMLDPWFQKEPGRRWKALRNRLYWRLAEHRVIRDAAAVLFTCERELELARTTFPRYSPQWEVNVGYGVPDPPAHTQEMDRSFHKTCPNLPRQQPFLLFLSRIHPKKGVDLLIRAYAGTFRNRPEAKGEKPIPDPHFQRPAPHAFPPSPITKTPPPDNHAPALVIAGPIDSGYAREMISLAQSLLPGCVFIPDSLHSSPIPDPRSPINGPCIHFSGMLQGNAKWGALHRCEALVLISHQENFGITVAEALSCAKPVLISDKVNIYLEIKRAGAGFAASDDMEAAMRLLCRWNDCEAPRRDEMSRNAKRLFHEKFHLAGAARDLLNGLVGGGPKTPMP